MKSIHYALLITAVLSILSCSQSEKKSEDKPESKDSLKSEEIDMPEIEEIQMNSTYEVTYKSGKVVKMTQEEYLNSGVWEDPEVIIKEIPSAN